MQKIAILGGTFDPIHNGHLHLVRRFCEHVSFDRVIFMPTKAPTHKTSEHLTAAEHRLAMCKIAAKSVGYTVSDMEICRHIPSYTVYTLEELKRQYPNDTLYWITGEDMFLSLLNWKDALRLFELAVFCAAPRSIEGMAQMQVYEKKLQAHGAQTILQNIDFLPISSTMVRSAVKAGADISGMVPFGVKEYIEQHGLYKE